MDRPKLTLVTSPATGYASINNKEFENDLLIDACDLEGVDAEEVQEESFDEGVVNEEDWNNLENSNSGSNVEGGTNGQCSFDYTSCPECDSKSCSRPVKELCGHVKCRQCFVTSEDACMQCLMVAEPEMKQKDAKGGSNEMEKIVADDDEEDDEEDDDEIRIVKPNEYVFELGIDGKRSIAVVSSETLRDLGIRTNAYPDPVNVQTETNDMDLQRAISPQSSNSMSEPEPPVSPQNLNVDHQKPKKSRNQVKKVNVDHIIEVKEQDENDSPKKWWCLKCNTDFTHTYQRKYHIYCNPENGRRPFVCHCSKEFVSQSHYLYHVRSKHTGEKPYECPVCSQRFIQKVKLNRHMVTHTIKSDPEEPSTYLCAHCRKRFTHLSSCKRHIRTHTEQKPFECDQCKKRFKAAHALKIHKRTHLNQRPYKCPDCSSAFSTAKDMRRHYLCHTGEKPFQCEFQNCGVKFRRKDNLERHIRQSHKLSDKMAKLLGEEAAKKYEEMRSSKESNDLPKFLQKKKRNRKKKRMMDEVVGVIAGT